jgi:plastocyanin
MKGEIMNRYVKVLVAALALALVLTACGGGGSTINVTITDFAYSPNTFTVKAGEKVTLHATNKGAVEHEFAIMKLGTSVTPPFGDKDEGNIYWELDEIQAGSTKSDTFTAPSEPGQYEVICGLAGHIEKGMVGTLVVK